MSDQITSQIPPAPSAPEHDEDHPPLTLLPPRRLRIWPGVVVIVLMWSVIKGTAWYMTGTMEQFMGAMMAPMAALALIALWWLFASRLRWTDRLLIPLGFVAAGTAAFLLGYEPDPNFRFMGLVMGTLPIVLTAWVGWLLVTPFLRWPLRRAGLLVALVLTFGYSTLLRMEGIDGSFTAQNNWRWTQTKEQKYLAYLATKKTETPAPVANEEPLKLQAGDWPGFRGANRDGKLFGVRVATDWDKNPPKQLWKQPIGPGWGSFAVVGKHLYTQEQRDQNELVVCYDADTGKELWSHADPARFTETIAGPGATPTFHEGKIYAFGATGLLNCLDAATGEVIWFSDTTTDSSFQKPDAWWGFASSPLVAHGIVVVFGGGEKGKCVLGYKADTGKLAWSAGEGRYSYCSPELVTLGGVEQVLMATDAGLAAYDLAKGDVLWQHSWLAEKVPRIVQPALLGDGDVLLGTGMGIGARRLHVEHPSEDWDIKEVWTTKAIRPYYNDLVIYQDHLYGFDGPLFTCLSLQDGKQRWRERGYGAGQVLLLADQGLLLILSEYGEVALVEAKPEYKELARFKALEGKTWNHPVVAHGKLFVRNGEEIACYQLKE